ncbi:MAG TPA: hypothetical protein VMU26_05370 [Candidatus Polarisedimenticolia bacterium]|nr:hypothetical protein [Candidatus Polarisedimenticolia bacterium]
MAKSQRLSDSRILVELIELGIEARKPKEKAFFELPDAFDPRAIRNKPNDWATSWAVWFFGE